MNRRLAIYPGTFDPITNGHLDVLKRGTQLFDHVIVGVTNNSSQNTFFTSEERKEMIKEVTGDLKNTSVEDFSGLLVDYAATKRACALIRGLRAISDFEYEFQMAIVNRRISDGLTTVFLMANEKYTYLNSTIVKEVAGLGGEVSSFVPPIVCEQLYRKLNSSC